MQPGDPRYVQHTNLLIRPIVSPPPTLARGSGPRKLLAPWANSFDGPREETGTSRQTSVDLLDGESKRRAIARRAAFETPTARSKFRNDGLGGCIRLLVSFL